MKTTKQLITLLFMLAPALSASAQSELTTNEAKQMIQNKSKKRVSVHDPSIIWEPKTQRYYIVGSHKAGAYTTNLQDWTAAAPSWSSANATAFTKPAVKKVKKGGQEVDMPQFNAMEWSARTDASYNIDGNLWAPDVIWNEKLQKWCMYLSINGDSWHSSIIMLTSNNVLGPYTYQAPVVICGFQDSGHSYKDTDLELVLGQTFSSLPSRYNVGSGWGRRWPHTIDPAVFYDEEGKLWMVYGSWSGGIWMLELDEETGLRDYDVTYPSTGGSSDGVTSDPYFGKKVAGGYYVSGEGPYIEHVGDYYYLFISYGFLDSTGGYVMRMFRSQNPDGPYKDAYGRSAIFDKYVMNYGKGADTRGVKLVGAYADWGYMTKGELAQGHNSVIAAPDGRTYLIYHTRFDDGSEGHQVRVHQLFQTQNGWLVASPFEYNGEELTDEDVKSRELFSKEEIAGTYQLLVHKYDIDYANREVVKPVSIVLHADGSVSGAYTGSWSVTEGTSYVQLKLNNVLYNGVVIEQQADFKSVKTVSFSALSNTGINIWAYKLTPKYALAWQLSNQKVPVSNNQSINQDIDLIGDMDLGVEGVSISWKSSQPDVISDYGKYNPTGLTESVPLTLTARAETTGWYWQEEYNVTAAAESVPTADWQSGMLAHYGFNDDALANSFDETQKAQLLRAGTTAVPEILDNEPMRTGKVVHTSFGANSKESYVEMPNPLCGKALDDGATVSFWVKRADDNLWDTLLGFVSGGARFFMTGNSYIGYNSGAGNWIDLNHPNDVQPGYIATGKWQLVTLTVSKTAITLYVNGTVKKFTKVNGKLDGTDITAEKNFNYQLILDLLASSETFCLGKGSFWGSADARFDDVIVYDRALKFSEVLALNRMENRVYDFGQSSLDAIGQYVATQSQPTGQLYDLQGRRVNTLGKGIYIKNKKKLIVR